MTAGIVPERLLAYLAHPSLEPVWVRVRTRLERGGLTPTGTVGVNLDEAAAGQLGGLLARTLPVGSAKLRLDELDAALRNSAAAAGLVTVLAELGGPLVDRAAAREEQEQAWAQVWAELASGLSAAGLAAAPWVPAFEDGLRRSGVLTRAGVIAAQEAVGHAVATLSAVADGTVLSGSNCLPEPRWELAALAGVVTRDAHGLDDGRLAAALVLRAAAAATGERAPSAAAERRTLWESMGVTPDEVSGTVLVWGLRPPGADGWAAMMRDRADLGLVTHLTLHELRATHDQPMTATGQRVYACENPQVLQAAARAGGGATLICFGGNPASAGLLLLARLLAGGADVSYHGDFDWPGVDITTRLLRRGARPWRMGERDYTEAVRGLPDDARLALSGTPVGSPWDERLSAAMQRHGVAVHEEALLPHLLEDLVQVGERV
ncbi:TIGR02679 family protein [Modestobacter sp. VKM Ac-2979]|uniref:TIGR02679 family protein n=1 Tax=unclassified Modestobacter TaxID=2643866 RepID=UPI0022AB9B36|nr:MULTISPECIES: TIGR02679 family protein [unclassified Modestobacter]MCZ2810118.1 TIGR02679 family protein [Modestobacter sp. VKM Ac-2979]MCZ2841604.1 TIGR02679 family protein [Modestobacter sp. VKM Ac-2980]